MLNKKHLTPIILLATLSFSVACEQKAEQKVIVNLPSTAPTEKTDVVDAKEEIKAIIEENAGAINSQSLTDLLATLHPLSPLKSIFENLGSQIFVAGTRQQILDVTNILHDEKTATAQVSRKVSNNLGVVLEKTSFSLEVSDKKWLIMNVDIHSQEQSF